MISGKKFFCEKIFKIKNVKQKLRQQVAKGMEADAIQKLALPHSWAIKQDILAILLSRDSTEQY